MCDVVVFVHWPSSEMQLVDPLTRLQSNCEEDMTHAHATMWQMYGPSKKSPEVAAYMGALGMPIVSHAMQLSPNKNVMPEPRGRSGTRGRLGVGDP